MLNEYIKAFGETDIAVATIIYFDEDSYQLKSKFVYFREDGEFKVYLLNEKDIEGDNNQLVAVITPAWLKIYDDSKRIFSKTFYEKTIKIITSGNSLILAEC